MSPSSTRRASALSVAFAIALTSAAGGCASTHLSAQWKDLNWSAPPLRSVFVVAAAKNVTRRRIFEDKFVDRLARHGVVATPSYRVFPDTALPTPDQIRDAVKQHSFDAVLNLRLVDMRDEPTYVAPTYTSTLSGYYLRPYWGYYGSLYTPFYEPGYVDITQIVAIEATLWDGRSDEAKLIWSGTTETEDPTTDLKLASSVSKRITGALRNEGMVP
jgi:hypothetical protein